jgi:hypothetical protein
MRFLILLTFLLPSLALATIASDDLWLRLKDDFESRNYFFNASINDYRNGVASPYLQKIYGDYAANNARPLSEKQLALLPDGEFISKRALALAMAGRERLIEGKKIKENSLLAIADFSKHSRVRRFYVIDVEKAEVLINTWVSHGYNSDVDRDGFPETFSNVSGSEKSSLGFMVTDVTYNGTYGYSQRLKGLDPALNSNVLSRAVVIHGFGGLDAHQASWGNISTSQGCLMFSNLESGLFWGREDKSMLETVIETLGKGALVFSYINDPLMFKSQWIQPDDLE